MNIYTSYFANVGKLPFDAVLISIARYAPKVWKGKECKSLAPPPALLEKYKQTHDAGEYTEWFNAVLDRKDIAPYKEMFEILSVGHDRKEHPIVLLCYERPGAFCHRHIVAEWLKLNGIPCEEWKG